MTCSSLDRPIRQDNRRPLRAAAGLAGLALLAISGNALSAPYVPDDPGMVIASLPERSGPAWDAIRGLRADAQRSPADSSKAARVAAAYLELFRREGDPRLLGYAEASLAPWSSGDAISIDAGLQGAALAGLQHRFDDARRALDRVLERDPRNGQAWLARASLDLTRGRYDPGREACARLLLLHDPIVSGTCLAAVQAMTGDLEQAHQFLARQMDRQSHLPAGIAAWIATLAAETAIALGDDDRAETYFGAALESDRATSETPSVYLVGAYTDFLLRRGNARAALAFARVAPVSDASLLRIARAKRLLGQGYTAEAERLRYRLRPALDGLDIAHAREAAYYALHVENDAEQAASLATANWAQQREIADAELLLESAARLCKSETGELVVDWMVANDVQHVVLEAIRARLSDCK